MTGVQGNAVFPCSADRPLGEDKAWIWEPFNPSLYEIAGCATYCMPLHEIERKENGAIRGLDIPFNALIDLFRDVHNQVTSG